MKRRGLAEHLAARGLPCVWGADPDTLYNGPDGAVAHETIAPLGSAARRGLVLRACTLLRDQVQTVLAAGDLPVTLGGDHAMGAASIAALARAKNAHGRIGVLWIDAHADINTPQTSPSQALHGMPLAALLGLGDPEFAALGGGPVVLRPEHVFYMGLRDVDAGEEETLNRLGIARMTAAEVRDIGYERAFARALAHIGEGTDYLFLSLDLDVFDPAIAPAVGTPVPDGFGRGDFLPALAAMVANNVFAGLEIAEYNPTLPGADETYDLLVQCLTFMLAARQPAAESA